MSTLLIFTKNCNTYTNTFWTPTKVRRGRRISSHQRSCVHYTARPHNSPPLPKKSKKMNLNSCGRIAFSVRNVTVKKTFVVRLGHVQMQILLSGLIQLFTREHSRILTNDCPRKYFSRYLWSALRWCSRSNCCLNSDTPLDGISSYCVNNMQLKQY